MTGTRRRAIDLVHGKLCFLKATPICGRCCALCSVLRAFRLHCSQHLGVIDLLGVICDVEPRAAVVVPQTGDHSL